MPEPLLERPDLQADGGLGDAEPLGRLREAAPLDDRAEGGELARVHKRILSMEIIIYWHRCHVYKPSARPGYNTFAYICVFAFGAVALDEAFADRSASSRSSPAAQLKECAGGAPTSRQVLTVLRAVGGVAGGVLWRLRRAEDTDRAFRARSRRLAISTPRTPGVGRRASRCTAPPRRSRRRERPRLRAALRRPRQNLQLPGGRGAPSMVLSRSKPSSPALPVRTNRGRPRVPRRQATCSRLDLQQTD